MESRRFASSVSWLALVCLGTVASCSRSADTPPPERVGHTSSALSSFVQSNFSNPAFVSVKYTSAQAAGDLNVVVVGGWAATPASVTSVTDTAGNTYALAVGRMQQVDENDSSIGFQSIYYAKNIVASAANANTVTVNLSEPTGADVRIVQYHGLDPTAPLDVTAGQTGQGTTTTAGAFTTTHVNDLIVAANMVEGVTSGPASGYTKRILDSYGNIVEDRVVTTAGSYTATAAQSPQDAWTMQAVAFKETGTGTAHYVQSNLVNTMATQIAPPLASVPVPITAAQAAGDLNMVAVAWVDNTVSVTSVTDTADNAYALAVGPAEACHVVGNTPAVQSIYYAKNIVASAAGANVVTVTFTAAVSWPDIRVLEYAGLDTSSPVDVVAQQTACSGTALTSGAATTTNASDLLVGSTVVSQGVTTTTGAGFTARLLTPDGERVEDEAVSAAGSYSATATESTSGSWIMQMVAFKVAGAVTCVASDACHVAGIYNPATGTCSNPIAANGTSCSDGNACTQTDSCQNGTCTGSNPVTCTASDACHTAGTCNMTTGACSNPVAANGTLCSDGNACTQTDTCQSGTCTGSNPVTCTASDVCHTAGTCDMTTGACSNPVAANGTLCSDGNACTLTDTCQSGTCIGSNPKTCPASDACHTAGACDTGTGACSNPVAANGTSCSDGNACTQNDACQSGTCVGGSAIACTADACHAAGACDPSTGCSALPAAADGTPCSGADKCNQDYACKAGACTGSNPVTCSASDACHVAGTCNSATGGCSNPAAADGTSCNDGNACTHSDACHAGTCKGSNPVSCAAADACHVAGECNPMSGACTNPSAPDGTSCGGGDASASQVCAGGACGGQPVCTPNQTLCAGACANTQTDRNNCGACGEPCAAGSSCVAGTCLSAPVLASCGLPAGSMSVLVSSDGVTAYVPNGSWPGLTTGIQRLVLEGGVVSAETIPTPGVVNSCASNWVTGETVCVTNGTDIYLIKGDTITATLTSGATSQALFSGGQCLTCGVAIDAAANKAILQVGLDLGAGLNGSGYQFLDLSTNVLDAPIPVASDPTQTPGQTLRVSEDVAVDSARHLVLSPNELDDYQVLKYGSGSPASFNNSQLPALHANAGDGLPVLDSAAEDCTTGIALASDESSPSVVLLDLTQAVFTPGSPNGSWTAPFSDLSLPGLPAAPGQGGLEMTGLSVAPGSHLAILADEDASSGTFVVLQLPSTSGSGTPALVDYAASFIATDPTGADWECGMDPHSVTAYTSPRTGRAMAIMANSVDAGQAAPTFVALIDLQGVLDAPRTPGTHNLDPTYDLAGHGVITFIPMPCSQASTSFDPSNCGSCGHVCPSEPNSQAGCQNGACTLACDVGYVDCNNDPSDGCEARLSRDPSNCGGCGVSCAAPNATGTCSGGKCGVQCNAGFSDCDGDANNGCETTGPCTAPDVSVSGPTSVAAGDVVTYVATATASPGRTLSFAWAAIAGPGDVTFSAPSALTTTADFSAAGTYTLQFEANDGFQTTAASLSVQVVLVNHPPVVSAGTAQTLAVPAMMATLSGSATDDGVPQGATLTATWSLVSGPVAVAIATPTPPPVAEPGPITTSSSVTFSFPGTYVFELDVSDTGLVGSATTTVTINPPAAAGGGGGAGPSAPTVAIGGVSDDQVVTKPTQILGTVSDGAWVLERRLGGRDDVQTAWTVMASGTGAENAASIATFDPTLLLNGIYTVRLTATNSAGSTATSVSLSVDGRMKVGDFTLSFTDLDVAVAGLPFTLTRVYDSRDKTVGDFGVGWKLGITDVRVEKSGKIGAYWQQQFTDEGVFGQFCLLPTQAATVTITFPGGREYRFAPQASPQCQLQAPNTTPDIVWVSTSDPDNPTIKLVAEGDTSVFASDTGSAAQLQTDTGDIWDPRQFTLTTGDGSVYQIDQDKGVTQVTDAGGNSLTVSPDGILHSSGTQVTFARDEKGRITTITDPLGQPMTYAYDDDGDLASYTDRLANVTQFAYATNHYLDQIQDPLGRTPIRNDYDASGRLLSTTDATGNVVHYSPNLADNQEQVTDRLGHVTLYTYNDRGDVTQKVDATGAVWNYTFDTRGNKLSATDPLGNTTSTTYDGSNNALTQTDALGRTTTYTYDSLSDVVTTTDALGQVTTSNWGGVQGSQLGALVSATDALGNTTLYTYDGYGRWFGLPVTQKDPLGNVTTNVYDDPGHLLQRTDPLGRTTSYTYDANGKRTSETASRSNFDGSGASITTTYQYDAIGQLLRTQKTFGSNPTRSTTYTATGKRATTTDEDGRVTSYTYDALDRLVTTAHPDGTTETQAYDAESHRISSTDGSGNTTLYAYDAVGRLIRTTYADGSSTSTGYDSAGRAIQTVDELGHVQWTGYDAAGRRVSTTDATGAVTKYAYDAAGNQISMTDALGHVTNFTYDADNRAVATTYADGTSDATHYDPAGRMVSKNDPLGRSTDYAYDALGELVKVTDALGNLTRYGYDETGARTSQQDANQHVTSFLFDLVTSAPIGRVLPDGTTESRTDDAAGQVLSRTDFAGKTTHYAYDAMGRVLTRTYPDSSVVSFTYTPTGQRATATDARGTTHYAYDSRNRLVQLTYPDGRVLAYGYDAHGERTSLTAKIGTQSLTTKTAYDAAGRPNTVTDPLGRAFGVTYDVEGAPTQMQYPNGTATTYAYDTRHRVTNIATVQTATSTAIASFAYVLDADGKRTQVTEADGVSRQYGYDGIDRLTTENVTGSLTYAKSFTYDSVGNRLSQTTTGAGAASVNYAYDNRDRLTTEDATTYAYDANGNVTSKSGEAAYGWDFENRLTSVTMSGGAVVAHVYDADGNRVKTSVTPSSGPATVANYLVDTGGGLSQVVADTDGSGNLTALYVRSGDELLAVMRPATGNTWTTRFVHGDGLGSVRVLTDETGTTIDSRAYEAFGTKNVEAGNDGLTYGFAGEPFEITSMLAYHRARWMDARVGRFEGMDRVDGDYLTPLTLHRYVYTRNNPINFTDPSGNETDIGTELAAVEIVGIEATIAEPSVAVVGESIVAGAESAEATGALVEEVETIGTELVDGDEAAQQSATELARELGAQGESVAGIVKNTTRIASATGRAAYRIPDVLNQGLRIIGEVKNVRYLAYASQLQDFAAFAEANGYVFQLIIRTGTVLSDSLEAAEASGAIQVLRVLP